MQPNENTVDLDPNSADLGPLAWVLDELRKSLDGANKALRRFVRDADLALRSDLSALDTSHLRIARQQLHQAEGALEMVGLSAPASLLRAMEAVTQKFVQRPELCTQDQAAKVERASYALIEYLEAVLRSRTVSPVALFPQYRDLQEMVGEQRVQPSDLWPITWHWVEIWPDPSVAALAYDDATRTRFDSAMLKVIKTADSGAAGRLRDLCLGFAAAQASLQPRTFWMICSAYFEAVAARWCTNDVYVKRASSRVLTQYISMARTDLAQADRLAHDLLFFCAQAAARMDGPAPTLTKVLQAYGLAGEHKAVDYETRLFGRFDPALLAQARKRIVVAKEMWAALSGGDTQKLKAAADQFNLVSDSLLKLDPGNHPLAKALNQAMEVTVRSGQAPTSQVAMEVATSVLFLEAAYDEMDPEDTQVTARSTRLAQRLDRACQGAEPEVLETWMEDLYRRVSERQTMGSVVSELGVTMSLLEKSMDQFFRDPKDKSSLQQAPVLFAQMRGVLSLLGLDQASQAVLYMRDRVEQILVDEIDEDQARAGTFDRLGNSLGALGFMIDMMNYQPTLAKKMFFFDPSTGEFRSVMGRTEAAHGGVPLAPKPEEPTTDVGLATVALRMAKSYAQTDMERTVTLREETIRMQVLAATPIPEPVAVLLPEEDDGSELRDIFIEEAREVLHSGLETLSQLVREPGDVALQTTLRRSFHTLKGSARMVDLNEYGEAAWSLEQLLNGWIAEQQPVSEALLAVSRDALRGLEAWVNDIATGADSEWRAEPFRTMADALRLDNKRVSLGLALESPELVEGPAAPQVAVAQEHELEFEATDYFVPPADPLLSNRPLESSGLQLTDIDFDSLSPPAATDHATAPVPEFSPRHEATVSFQAQPDAEESVPSHEELDLDLPDIPPAVTLEAEPVVVEETLEVAASEPLPNLEPETIVEPEEDVKVIGSLRIGIPLYNVYLNEADEWSRRLVTELAEWSLESHQPLAESTVALAHSLAGSSATVGFMQLSSVARDLEHAMEHVQLLGRGTPHYGQTFADAAQDIRRLLHQFAAGFIKEPEPQIVLALKAVLEAQVSDGPAVFADPAFEDSDPDSNSISSLDDDAGVSAPAVALDATPVMDFSNVLPGHESVASSALLTPIESLLSAQIDEIDVQDAIDPDLFPIFEEEALSLMPGLAGALRQWAARPENLGARAEALRALHTLKGSARLAGAMRMGEMSHRFESFIEALGTESLQPSLIEPMLTRFDDLQTHFDQLRKEEEVVLSAPLQPVVASAADAAVAQPHPVLAPVRSLVMPSPLPMTGARASALQSVRVRPQLLDRLVNQAGEVMMTRSRLEAGLGQLGGSLGDLTGNLERLRSQLRDIELQAETQMQSRLAQSKDSAQGFDPLEFDRFTRVQELTRMMAESVNDVATVQRNLQRAVESTEDNLVAQARQTRELQRDLLRTRMVEFESIAERLYGVVRQAGKDVGKQVRLDIVGGSIEMDRSVLDRMTSAFEHLLRNCVGHGIEDAQTRARAEKDPVGTITIALNQAGNDVSVEFSDDGGGLDLKRIQEKAKAMGLIADEQALDDAQAANLIFMPGFSTAEHVTELAGRGIGMDVVRAEVSALGGRIETRTEQGKGSHFKLILPLTTAVTQVVILRAGNLTFGVPSNLIAMVRRVKPETLSKAYDSGWFEDGGLQSLEFFWSGALLQATARSHEMDSKTLSVVVCRSAGQRVALHVDEVLGNQEVVVKNLGVQLARLPGLAAMTVLASGAVVLIYNPVALATVYGEDAHKRSRAELAVATMTDADRAAARREAEAAAAPRTPLVLVVDDSITVRRVTQRLLLREGYRVALAVDGLQALERLQEELPAVVLTDIEMPRMDGFDLARNIRGDERMHGIPIIMITSRIADKHRQHATELGVNHYLGKPYSEEELLNLVQHYCLTEAVE